MLRVMSAMTLRIAMLAAVAWLLSMPAWAQIPLEVRAREAILIDLTTNQVLIDKNSQNRMPTASMSKLMTQYMLFQAIDAGRVSLSDRFTVSQRARDMGGSRMFLELGTSVTVEDLIRGLIVHSGNDTAVVIAEGLAPSEAEFAVLMTDQAQILGMAGSNFVNASGWPHPNHYSTARDLAILAARTIADFPQMYGYFAEREFTYNGIKQLNRNPLLGRAIGADGLKTGHTVEAGYGLVASAERNGRRLVLVINGLDSSEARSAEAERLLNWAFREFRSLQFFAEGEQFGAAEVWMGTSPEVSLHTTEELTLTVPIRALEAASMIVRSMEPVSAPIISGAELAELVLEIPGVAPMVFPLVAGQDVARRGPVGRVRSGAAYFYDTFLR